MRKVRQGGFTLMELMITVAIVGILVAVALPSYNDSVRKNRRATAQAHLSDVAQKQQQYLMDNRAYTDSATTLKAPAPADVSAYYDLVIVTSSTPPAFTATATPRGPQASDVVLKITNNGTKLPAGVW